MKARVISILVTIVVGLILWFVIDNMFNSRIEWSIGIFAPILTLYAIVYVVRIFRLMTLSDNRSKYFQEVSKQINAMKPPKEPEKSWEYQKQQIIADLGGN